MVEKLIATLRDWFTDMAVISDNMDPKIAQYRRGTDIDIISYNYPCAGAPRGIRGSVALVNEIGTATSQSRRIAVVQTDGECAGILAAVQLIHMWITARDAVDLPNVKAVGVGTHMHDEQFLVEFGAGS